MVQENTLQVTGQQETDLNGRVSTEGYSDTLTHGTVEKTSTQSPETTISTTQPACSPSSSPTSTESTEQTTE